MIAGCASCADIERLRSERTFGDMPSDSTVFRAVHEITPSLRAGLCEAVADVHAEVWARSTATTGTGPVYLDIDASLVQIHSENKEADLQGRVRVPPDVLLRRCNFPQTVSRSTIEPGSTRPERAIWASSSAMAVGGRRPWVARLHDLPLSRRDHPHPCPPKREEVYACPIPSGRTGPPSLGTS